MTYSIYQNYTERQSWANSVDPDQMLHTASDLGLHCLQLIQLYFKLSKGSKTDLFKVKNNGKELRCPYI